jgi:hypothetical protein
MRWIKHLIMLACIVIIAAFLIVSGVKVIDALAVIY